MRENDISVDIGAVSDGVSRIYRTVRNLDKMARIMEHNLRVAAKDFTSVNFARAVEIISDVEKKLSETVARVEKVKSFSERLSDCAQNYLYTRY